MKDGLILMAELRCNEMLEYRLRSYNSESRMYIGRTVNQTVNKMVTEWSPMVTEWSPSDHRVITEWSPSGYQTVTEQSQVVTYT